MDNVSYTVAEVLHICRTEECVIVTKTDAPALRVAVNEAVGRGYLYKSQPGVYRLTPSGYGFLDELERQNLSIAAPTQYMSNPNKIKTHIGCVFVSVKKFFKNSTVQSILKYVIAPLAVTLIGAFLAKYFI